MLNLILLIVLIASIIFDIVDYSFKDKNIKKLRKELKDFKESFGENLNNAAFHEEKIKDLERRLKDIEVYLNFN